MYTLLYRVSGIFRVGLIFAEFATSLKSPKIDTAKNKPYYTSTLRVHEIAKIGLSENLTRMTGQRILSGKCTVLCCILEYNI